MLIHEFINNVTKERYYKSSLIYDSEVITYGELEAKVNYVAKCLTYKIKKAEKILLTKSNPIEQLVFFLAIIKAGGVCVFAHKNIKADVRNNIIKKHNISFEIHDDFLLDGIATKVLPKVSDNDIFLGALSSGTTGIPKVIWRSHKSWTSAFKAQSELFHISSSDKLYLVGSLSYTANLNACLHVLSEGGTVIFAKNKMPRTWYKDIVSHSVTALFMVPAILRVFKKIIEQNIISVTSIITGGAKIDIETVKFLLEYFPNAHISEYYGASELGHVTYADANDLLKKPLSVGKPFPGVKITIEEGIVWVESSYIAPEYLPKATVEDLGKLDNDGYLHIKGRKNGIINVAGVNVNPIEVEQTIKKIYGVLDVVVSGIKDNIKGEIVCAWIVKCDESFDISKIKRKCLSCLPKYYCPQVFMIVDELPLNANGKIDYRKLEQLTNKSRDYNAKN